MDEIKKIVLIAGTGISAMVYGFTSGYLSLLEYYILFVILTIFIGSYTAWNFFIRRAFSFHFQVEEGNHLREISAIRIVPFDKDKTIYEYKGKNYWIDSRNTVYTDRRNKSHLFFPINNVFAFHPFAKTYSLKPNGEIPDEFRKILTPENELDENDIKVPSEVLSPEQEKEREAKVKSRKQIPIGSIPIEFFTLMTVSAIEFAQMFSGKLIIARVEAMRNKAKRVKGDLVLGGAMGIMLGLMIGIVIYPAYSSYATVPQPHTNNPLTTTITSSTITNTTIPENSVPPNSTLIGESSVVNGQTTTMYRVYEHSSTTITITITTTGK